FCSDCAIRPATAITRIVVTEIITDQDNKCGCKLAQEVIKQAPGTTNIAGITAINHSPTFSTCSSLIKPVIKQINNITMPYNTADKGKDNTYDNISENTLISLLIIA